MIKKNHPTGGFLEKPQPGCIPFLLPCLLSARSFGRAASPPRRTGRTEPRGLQGPPLPRCRCRDTPWFPPMPRGTARLTPLLTHKEPGRNFNPPPNPPPPAKKCKGLKRVATSNGMSGYIYIYIGIRSHSTPVLIVAYRSQQSVSMVKLVNAS